MNLIKASAISLLFVTTALASNAFAAGRVSLAIGDAAVRSGNSALRPVHRGDTIDEGDLLHTGPDSLLQLRMDDGALIALRSNTEFRVDTYRAAAEGRPPLALLSLFKGGFRTITGLIGRFNHDEYQLATPIATIGIRGTDYSALFCASDCKRANNGLHARASAGAIVTRNLSGVELLLTKGEYGYIADGQTPPERRDRAPDEMGVEMPAPQDNTSTEGSAATSATMQSPAPSTQTQAQAEARAGSVTGSPEEISVGSEVLVVSDVSDEPGTPGFFLREAAPILYTPPQPKGKGSILRFAGGGASDDARIASVFSTLAAQSAQIEPGTLLDTDGALLAVVGADAVYAIGEAQTRDSGFDAASGLRWGRWAEGSGRRDGEPLPLQAQSLHWIYDADLGGGTFALPKTGEASYTLVGNTNPTDNHGQVGFLGSATLSADFTNQTVNSNLQLGIGNTVWQASGSGAITPDTVLFGGNYDRVTVDGAAGGSGRFDGFLVPGANDTVLPPGAGLGYTLGNGSSTINGTAAFGNPVPIQSPAGAAP